ncbi:MAG: 2-hydroxyglutaryl-CoA dehydratase [Clostridiales bacterium]|nr:2-hydroxyglutaryl-CoA dehydratase [Clostridiales bacterium]
MARFTKEMKSTHKILVPNMLPIHFNLLINVFKQYGYDMELLLTDDRKVIDEGLKHVHNDTCYPALLVIGQFMDALGSGKYDPEKTALLITQTGGGCRASNYLHLLRKSLADTYPNVPVISLNFSGFEKGDGFELTFPLILKLLYGVLYGDLLMLLYNQCLPYEINAGDTDKKLAQWEERLAQRLNKGRARPNKKIYKEIIEDFASIERSDEKKPKVGIIGEIYVKYSPLANNKLEEFLVSEGCEPVMPGLLDFCLYCVNNNVKDGEIYNFRSAWTFGNKIVYKILNKMHRTMIKAIEEHGEFDPPHDFEFLKGEADKYIHQGVKMGEGWLITAEMAALAQTGVENIICTQPFGCLPNHIVAKGMSRVIKENFPHANIVAIDYDPGATKVNQENRIKLMLANAIKSE